MQLRHLVFIAAVVCSHPSAHGQDQDRRLLINEIQSFQASAAGKTIRVKGSFEIRSNEATGTVSYRKPIEFKLDRSRFYSSQYLVGSNRSEGSFLRYDLGYDGKCSVQVTWTDENTVSATKNSRKPATLDILDRNLVGGTCIAYGPSPPGEKWLKALAEESFLEAFLRESDTLEQTSDSVLASKQVGTQLYSVVLKRKPMLHCVQYRKARSTASTKLTETIRMDYSMDKGFPQLVRTNRSVTEKPITAVDDSCGVELVAATVELESLEFLDQVKDDEFLPNIPQGALVTELRP